MAASRSSVLHRFENLMSPEPLLMPDSRREFWFRLCLVSVLAPLAALFFLEAALGQAQLDNAEQVGKTSPRRTAAIGDFAALSGRTDRSILALREIIMHSLPVDTRIDVRALKDTLLVTGRKPRLLFLVDRGETSRQVEQRYSYLFHNLAVDCLELLIDEKPPSPGASDPPPQIPSMIVQGEGLRSLAESHAFSPGMYIFD